MVRLYVVRSTCRVCDSNNLEPVLSFGKVPLAGALLAPPQLLRDEATYPLDVVFCADCSLLQVIQTVSPGSLQEWSTARTSRSAPDSEPAALRSLAERLTRERRLGPESLVIEAASGDGALLREFQARHVSVLGIEPWSAVANRAREAGVPTLSAFFTRDLAHYLKSEQRQADVLIARDVLPHVPDVHGFLSGVRTLLKDNGIALIEVPYVRDLVDHDVFESLGHDRLCYFSLAALVEALERADLWTTNVTVLGANPSILRLEVARNAQDATVGREHLHEEAHRGIGSPLYYRRFSERATSTRDRLRTLIEGLRRDGKRVAAYGATAGATTLLNYAGLDHSYVDFVVDEDTQRQGRFVPGVHLPVLSPDSLLAEIPDFLLLLDRRDTGSLEAVRPALARQGTRFIVPAPTPSVV